ncbi:zinc finger protein 669-like isoform X2 [Macaca nemestrina]
MQSVVSCPPITWEAPTFVFSCLSRWNSVFEKQANKQNVVLRHLDVGVLVAGQMSDPCLIRRWGHQGDGGPHAAPVSLLQAHPQSGPRCIATTEKWNILTLGLLDSVTHCLAKQNHMVQRLCESKEGSQYGQAVSHIPNLDLNENISTGLKQCECSICGKVFVHHSLLNRHILAHSGYKPYGEKQYKCEQCGKLFVSVPGVRRHRIMHSGNPAYKCMICGKAFHFLNSVERHQRTHTGEKPYKCKQCGKAFTVSGSCLIHGRTHTGEKPYECKECGKTLRFSCFKMHERTHTGERCTKCDKAFSCSTSLHDHGSIHTGERPYECKQCGKAFSCLSSLCNHRSTHTGEKPYECKQCDQAFSRLSSLHLHERIHTGEKPYE